MNSPRLIFGLLDNSGDFPDARSASRARDLSICWSRYKYFGPILEDCSLDKILSRAAESDADYCFIQSYGHILAEIWRPDDAEVPEIMQAIEAWIEQTDFLVTGHINASSGGWYGLDPACLLINLIHYRALECPLVDDPPQDDPAVDVELISGEILASGALAPTRERTRLVPELPGWNLLRTSLEAGHTVYEFPAAIDAGRVRLDPDRSNLWMLQKTKTEPSDSLAAQDTSVGQQEFLDNIHQLTGNLRNAIFVWNLESYQDIETPSDHFEPPLTALYTVSAGFKPNRILQTHGFDANTRMVVYDYSPQGLEFRRLIHEEWDGIDYPSFLKILFQKVPSSEAHYLLWDGMTPENLDWNLVNRRWREELDAWDGEEALYQHWQKFRLLDVEYVSCNILTENELLLNLINDEENALIWWSNAFFSVYSNWFYSIAQRQNLYRQWISKLARKAPRLILYGSDCNNISVNCYTAQQYGDWLQSTTEAGFDELAPAKLHQHEMRF